MWLAWLRCTNTEQHKNKKTVLVVTDNKEKRLVRVRPLPLGFTQLEEVTRATHGGGACSSHSCQLAHSEDELLYWKWQVARNTIFVNVSKTLLDIICTLLDLEFYPSVLRLYTSM